MTTKIKTFVLALLCVFSLNIFAQTLKTYSGNYEGGTATYQYYENADYARVFNGSFVFGITTKRNAYSIESTDIKGNFKDNLKNGIWIVTYTFSAADRLTGDMVGVKQTTTGNYENGKKVGKWTVKQVQALGNKQASLNETYNFKFVNNVLVDSIITSTVKGKLDNNGLYTGTWNLIAGTGEKELEYIAEFRNNVFSKLIVRQTSDGKILDRYDNSELVKQVIDTNNSLMINGQVYELKSFNEDKSRAAYAEHSEYNKNLLVFATIALKEIHNIEAPISNIFPLYKANEDKYGNDIGAPIMNPLGSPAPIIQAPQVLVKKELSISEKKSIEEEKIKIKIEKAKKEKEKQTLINTTDNNFLGGQNVEETIQFLDSESKRLGLENDSLILSRRKNYIEYKGILNQRDAINNYFNSKSTYNAYSRGIDHLRFEDIPCLKLLNDNIYKYYDIDIKEEDIKKEKKKTKEEKKKMEEEKLKFDQELVIFRKEFSSTGGVEKCLKKLCGEDYKMR